MKTTTIENVKGSELPQSWARRAEVRPDEVVTVTVEPARARRTVDRAAVDRLLQQVDAARVLDERTAEEIIGYDEHGLPA